MDKESYFISLFENQFIGDDASVIDGLIYSSDLFCEDIHFKRSWMSLKQIAYKSMIVNISDAVAMNAKPKYALLNIKIPSSFTREQLKELSHGFLKACKEYGCQIIGGDTVAGEKLDISITIISKSNNPLFRSGIKVGDLIGYTGDLGSVAKDLNRLLNGQKIADNSKFISPTLRADFVYKASPYLKAAMDISDSLSKDLSRLSQINSLGFEFLIELEKDILCSGEEYEILFACKKENSKEIEDIAKKTGTKVTFFAKAVEGIYHSICKEHHFE
jgi:thiamine-monophosphate kinase